MHWRFGLDDQSYFNHLVSRSLFLRLVLIDEMRETEGVISSSSGYWRLVPLAWVSLGRFEPMFIYGVHHAHHQACLQFPYQGTPLPLWRCIPTYFHFIHYVKIDLRILMVTIFSHRFLLLEAAVHRLLCCRQHIHEIGGFMLDRDGELVGGEGHSAYSLLRVLLEIMP